MACDLYDLAAAGSDFKNLPAWKFQSSKIFMLALIVKANGGEDFTNLTALAEQMKQYKSMSENDLQAAYLQVIRQSVLDSRAEEVTPAEFEAAVKAGVCIPPDLLRKAEIYLTCAALESQNQ